MTVVAIHAELCKSMMGNCMAANGMMVLDASNGLVLAMNGVGKLI